MDDVEIQELPMQRLMPMSKVPRRVLGVAGAVGVMLAVGCLADAGSALASPSYSISLYAGSNSGTAGPPTAGAATSSDLDGPAGAAADSDGNLYIADSANNTVEKVSPSGTLSILAGTGTQGAPTPGVATSSDLFSPQDVAVDPDGNVYIADSQNYEVEKVTPSGTLSIIAGDGTSGPATPGPATSSPLGVPYGVAVDPSGNVYIVADGYNEVLKVTPDGTLSVFAGNGNSGALIPGPATSSPVSDPAGLVVDSSGDVYIASADSYIFKVDAAGDISTVAGDGLYGPGTSGPALNSSFGEVAGLSIDAAGNVYAADGLDVYQLTPDGTLSVIAGNGTTAAPTYGGPATSSALNSPEGVASTPAGKVFIGDTSNNTIDQIAPDPPVLITAPDMSGSATIGQPLDAGSGAWTNDPVIYSYQWEDCDTSGANCLPISGATAASYTPAGNDAGHTLRVLVTAANGGGAATSASPASNVIQALSIPPTLPAPVSPVTVAPTTPTTTAAPPSTVGGDVTTTGEKITGQSALLGGTVAAHAAAISYRFQYGSSQTYGKLTSAQSLAASTDAQTVHAEIGHLIPGRVYHYRLMVTDAAGDTSYGADKALRTPRVAPARVRDHIYHYREPTAPYVFRVHEWLRLHKGLAHNVACQTRGYTMVSLVLHGRQIAHRRVHLNAACTVNTTFRFTATQLPGTGNLWFHMRYGGNHQLTARTALTLRTIYGK